MFDNEKLWQNFILILKGCMALVYLLLGGLIIQRQWFMVELNETISWALGGLLILYGLHRLYRTFLSK